ncbi:MAG: basR [Cytophagaceae bacterium]|jgi:DNA-binding response OmpR family regulator|nr:basR [Cytophagaceae bacterium]
MKILAIADGSTYTLHAKSLAKETGFTIELVSSFAEASEKVHLYEYDCILLFSATKGNWQQILTELILQSQNSGLILLKPELAVDEKVNAFQAGADDCLSIPYHTEELKARILAIVRRKKFNTRHLIHFANTVIDLGSKNVCVWDNPITLTPKEYDILLYLIMNRHKAVQTISLAEYLWGEESENKESNNLLITHIRNLRKKLVQAKAEVEIKNIYAVGYQIIEL